MSRRDLFWTCFAIFGVACTLAEVFLPARKLRYFALDAAPLDAVAFGFYQFVVFPLAVQVSDPVYKYIHPFPVMSEIWLPLRVVAFYLVADCGSYWMHRLMHTRHVWRIHRWHHSTKYLYWLSGARATIPQQILFNLPFIITLPILVGAPPYVYLGIMVEGVFRNNWMHMNVSWRSSWIEKVFVTPRYHHIHHSDNAELHDGNYGSLFSIWDRLFGTFINPDTTKLEGFGIRDGKPNEIPSWMIGV